MLAARGAPASPADLAAFPTVSLGEGAGLDRWRLTNGAGEIVEAAHEPRLTAGAFPLLREAVLGGVGVGLLPEYASREYLESGQLVRVLPDWEAPQGILHLVFTSRRGLLPGVRATLDFLAATLRSDSPAWQVESAMLL